MTNKKFLSLFFLVVITMTTIFAQSNIQKNTLKVSAKGSVVLTADMASVSLAVQTSNAIPSVAAQENAQIMEKVQKAVLDLGIEKKDIQTKSYNLYQDYRYTKSDEEIKEYKATNTLQVTIRNLDLVAKVIDVALDAGANQLSQLSFLVSDSSQAYTKARELAIEKATENAQTLAKAAGRTIGKAIYIEEENTEDFVYETADSVANVYMTTGRAATPINSGTSKISITATVIFELK